MCFDVRRQVVIINKTGSEEEKKSQAYDFDREVKYIRNKKSMSKKK